MLIPRFWKKISGDVKRPDGKGLDVFVWGWGDDESSALSNANERLQRVLSRLKRGDAFPDKYDYGSLPIREEILQTIPGDNETPTAMITRNRYGALILNTSNLLFLDVDTKPDTFFQSFMKLFGGKSSASKTLSELLESLRKHPKVTFRIYETAAGFRVIAIGRDYDPTGLDAQTLMRETGTDPAFSRLCKIQKSFRARLTPKPWRCGSSLPPGQHPRQEATMKDDFSVWLSSYESKSAKYSTCHYLQTIGTNKLMGEAKLIVGIHDKETRCMEKLPLA